MGIRNVQAERAAERDRAIVDYHVHALPTGLVCPLCQRWSPVNTESPQGVRIFCRYADCGVLTIMPRVPLARAIRRRTA